MKLTQGMRDTIKSKVVAAKFDSLFAKQDAAERAFANRLLDKALDNVDLSSFPDGWFAENSSLRVSFDGWSNLFSLGEKRRQPYRIDQIGLRFRQGDDAYVESKNLEQLRSVLEQQRKELRTEIDNVLHAVTTDKRLAEVWPEAVEYLPKVPAPVPAVVNVDRLRKMLA